MNIIMGHLKLSWSILWYELEADKTWQQLCCAWLLKQKHMQSF